MPKRATVKKNKLFSIDNIIPEANGYLVVDPKKCTGCASCQGGHSILLMSSTFFKKLMSRGTPLNF